MRRVLWIAFLVCAASGCYTVLRHPRVEDDDSTSAFAAVAAVDDCRACHTGGAWDPWFEPIPCPPAWTAYYREPWWTRAQGRAHPQGGGLTNDRPRPPVPMLLPPPTAVSPPPPTAVVPTQAKPPGRATQGADRPRPPGRGSDRTETPHPPADSTEQDAPADSARAAPPAAESTAPATQNQGQGLPSRSPKP
jgi:hypothetical protein